jgi:hypothetical protein
LNPDELLSTRLDRLDLLRAGAEARVGERLRRAAPDLFERRSVEVCFDALFVLTYLPYNEMPDWVDKLDADLASRGDAAMRADFWRLMLCRLIGSQREWVSGANHPGDIPDLIVAHWLRIVENIDSTPDAFFSPREDKYLKDLGLCRMTLLPVGAGLLDTNFVLPRRFLLAGGARQLLRGAWFIHRVAGGRSPWFRFHIDSRFLEEFNPEGWDRAYLRAAALLRANPTVLGVARSTWFFDPALETVSPRLAYLRRTIVDNGGATFLVGPSENATRDALARSETRRRLYDEGRYRPMEYMALWPREALLKWADSNAERGMRNAE